MPGALPTTVIGPLDIFTQAGQLWERLCEQNPVARFEVRIATLDGTPVVSANGLRLHADVALPDVDAADLVVVSSADVEQRDTWKSAVVPELLRLHRGGAQIASVCTGAFALAETGLLDGRIATTHWGFAPAFRTLYPAIDLRVERMLTHDANLLCSGGINAYAELCLYLVEHWCGYETAEHLARALVLEGWRDRQSDYALFDFQKQHGDDGILKAQLHMERHLAEPLNVAALAAVALMSERNFKRRFKQATGDTPNAYLQRLRVEHARHTLARSNDAMERVAEQCGYRDVAHFRKVFKDVVGMPPQAYRTKTRITAPHASAMAA